MLKFPQGNRSGMVLKLKAPSGEFSCYQKSLLDRKTDRAVFQYQSMELCYSQLW